MDAHSPTVEPTPPPNLRRVGLKPTPATPNERADPRQNNRVPGGLDAGDAPFHGKRQMSAFEVFEKNTRGDRNDILEPSHPSARRAPRLGAAPRTRRRTRSRKTRFPLFREGRRNKRKREASEKRSRASSEETAAVPSRAHVAARGGAVVEAVSPLEALASPDPHHACRECARRGHRASRRAASRSAGFCARSRPSPSGGRSARPRSETPSRLGVNSAPTAKRCGSTRRYPRSPPTRPRPRPRGEAAVRPRPRRERRRRRAREPRAVSPRRLRRPTRTAQGARRDAVPRAFAPGDGDGDEEGLRGRRGRQEDARVTPPRRARRGNEERLYVVYLSSRDSSASVK